MAALDKAGRLFAQMVQPLPKQFFGHLGRTFAVGVGKSIATRRRCAAHTDQRAGVQLQGITQVIQAKTVTELSVQQAYPMAPRRKSARLVLGSRSARYLRHQKRRNVIANLAPDGELETGWGYFELIHLCRVAGENKKLQPFLSNPVGWLWSKLKTHGLFSTKLSHMSTKVLYLIVNVTALIAGIASSFVPWGNQDGFHGQGVPILTVAWDRDAKTGQFVPYENLIGIGLNILIYCILLNACAAIGGFIFRKVTKRCMNSLANHCTRGANEK